MKIPKISLKREKPKTVPAKGKKKVDTVSGNGTIEQAHAAVAGRYIIWGIALFTCFIGAIGATLGGLALMSNPTAAVTQEIQKQQASEVVADQAAAYAQGYLTAYLSATKDNHKDLDAYVGEDAAASSSHKIKEPIEFRNLAIASVEKTNYGYYSTKIQIEVKNVEHYEENGESKENITWNTQWYKVIISSDGNGKYSPVGYPAATNSPETSVKQIFYPYSVANVDVTSAVGDFGKAYLSETGDINRYISPNADIAAISPAPYQETALVGLTSLSSLDGPTPADNTKVYVLAEYEVTDKGGNTRKQTYPLELTSRGGRWEVSTIERSPHTF